MSLAPAMWVLQEQVKARELEQALVVLNLELLVILLVPLALALLN